MKLEAITVADDPTFLPKLEAATNLPEFIKEGLPGLYGEARPPVRGSRAAGDAPSLAAPVLAGRVNATVKTLRQFLGAWRKFTLEERKTVVDQALLVLEQNYVHLPYKRAMYGIDPVQRLRLLRYRLDQLEERPLPPDIEFHTELTQIFHSLRDLHTTYRLPYHFGRGRLAAIPGGRVLGQGGATAPLCDHQVVGKGEIERLQGAEILHWNGTPIETAIASMPSARRGAIPMHATPAVEFAHPAPARSRLPPDEDW